ncbi:hypothetical protein Anas_10832 [Armadillidium nasatum]|uniref:Uncharacterized protein n=1 Tax=Armadillidium nasatum TaxID=96803 RepID=A0A5N5TC28_9CRUS|nr:hypothetical protein Anas_10832 [Armadillidium nasatum]
MNLRRRLKCAYRAYVLIKVIQLVYQIVYVALLAERNDGNITPFIMVGSLILILICISCCKVIKHNVILFYGNASYLGYFNLIKLDVLLFLFALCGYPEAHSYSKQLKLINQKNLHAQDIKDSLGLELGKMNRDSRDLLDEATDNQINTTTNILVDKALDLRSGIISFMNFEDNSSEPVDNLASENNVITTQTLNEPTEYISSLLLLTIFSFIFQFIGILTFGYIEFLKYRIRKLPEPTDIDIYRELASFSFN